MYDPYPYKINKAKIIILVLICIFLSIGFFALKTSPDVIHFSQEFFLSLEYLRYLFFFALLLLGFKTFMLLFSREYIYLFAGIISYLLIHLTYKCFFIKFFNTNLIFRSDSSFSLTAGLVFFIFFLLSAYNSGKIIPPKNRKKIVARIITGAAVSSIVLSGVLFYFILRGVLTNAFQPTFLTLLKIINILILLNAIIKLIQLYHKTRHNIYFWFITPVLLFIFSVVYLFPQQNSGDSWIQSSFLLQLAGFAVLIWVPFVEHTRFMESETKLRRSLEKSLFQSERDRETYSNLVNKVDVGICTFDEKGKIIFSNERLATMLGFSKEKLINQNIKELFDLGNLETFQIELEKLKTGVSSQFEIEIQNRRSQNIPVMISAVPVFDLRERFTGSRMVIFEISAWKDFERKLLDYSENLKKIVQSRTAELENTTEQLRRAKTYYETLISGMLDILLVIDKKGDCTFINNYGKKLLGYTANELKSSRLPDFFTDLDRMRRNYGDAMKVELRDYEAEVKTKDGRRILCSWNVRYLFDHNNRHIGAMCVGRDISEFKAMQLKLEKQTQNLEKLVFERTEELNVRVEQFRKILQIGEEITLNVEIGKILNNICQTIKNFGWRIVILSLKNQKSTKSRIVAYAGISKSRIQNFVDEHSYLFEDTFKFLRDEFKISQSFLVRNASAQSVMIHINKLKTPTNGNWQQNDVLIIPIKIKERILGFVTIFEPVDKTYPNEQHIQLLEIFVHKAAVAIENRRLFEETEARARQLEQVNKVRTDFFTNMSHELRTPLNSIITLTSVLLKKMSGELNAEQLKQIQIIKHNGENLLKLINNILDLSKIDAGRMDVNYSYFSLSQLVKANIEAIRPLCQRKKLILELKLDKKLPEYIFSDQDKIKQVLTNILGNAIKFTQKGKIKVSVKPANGGSKIHFSVADTGIGMDKKEIDQVFQAFKQLDHTDRRRFEGTGLGLSISKQLWTLLGGSISVESKKGKGTNFHLLLPIREVRDKIKQIPEQIPIVTGETTSPTSANRKSKTGKNLILLVDDNQDNLYAVKFILEDKGYRIVFAKNGAEGIQKAVKLKPDLILMDMMMPDVDGYQATQKIRTYKTMKNVPIIAMTAKSPQEDRRRAIKAGCNEYLTKPFNLDDILKKVNKWLG
jgi:PAS domain S-box-containing protein